MIGSLTPSEKGAVAEARVAAAALELGLIVLRPLCEGSHYDLVLDLDPPLLRVQCKRVRVRDSAVVAQLRRNRCTPNGYVRSAYSRTEIDAVAIYVPELDGCFLLPASEVVGRRAVYLRLTAAVNGQCRRIRWAEDYRLERVLCVPGEERTPDEAAKVMSSLGL